MNNIREILAYLEREYGISVAESADLKPIRETLVRDGMSRRAATRFEPRTIDMTARTVEIVAATEDPCTVLDYDRWQMVDEVLLMSGLRTKEIRNGKVPLLDAHQRATVRNVLGSA